MWLVTLCLGVVSSQSLLSTKPLPRGSYPGCSQPDADTCYKAEVDFSLLRTGDTIQLEDLSLQLKHRENSKAVFRGKAGEEAVFTWRGNYVSGSLHTGGRVWQLQGCGEGCYLWVRQRNDWQDEADSVSKGTKNKPSLDWERLRAQGETDTSTVVTYSIMIWTTPQFEESFASPTDMELFIDQIFLETNEGYINSEIPVRAQLHAIKSHPTLVDIYDAYQMIDDFRDSMPKAELLNCADAAALLVYDFSSCGIAQSDTTSYCSTFSVTQKGCATGYYSFGHEIGHNFGANHNPEQYSYTYGDNYAHLIQPNISDSPYTGYRTILGYNALGHYNRVNYYSNPDVIFPTTGTATGVTDVSNNAKEITSNRFAMAACGTEEADGECNNCDVHSEVDCLCSSNPPAAPSGSTSDWTGSLASGTVVTYSCNKGSDTATTVCDSDSRLWNPSSISDTLCESDIKSCGQKNYVPAVSQKTLKKKTGVKNDVDCQSYCLTIDGANYFKFKTHKKVSKRVCYCVKVTIRYKTKKKGNFISGPLTC